MNLSLYRATHIDVFFRKLALAGATVVSVAILTTDPAWAGGDETDPRSAPSSADETGSEASTEPDDGRGGDEDSEEDDSDSLDPSAKQRAAALAMQNAVGPHGWIKRYWTWDLNYALQWSRLDDDAYWLHRFRTGVTWVPEPNAFTLGATMELSGRAPPAFGLQAEALSVKWGGFMQLGGFVDIQGRGGAMLGVGWQIIGGELYFRRFAGGRNEVMGFLKLRVPVSWIAEGIERRIEKAPD